MASGREPQWTNVHIRHTIKYLGIRDPRTHSHFITFPEKGAMFFTLPTTSSIPDGLGKGHPCQGLHLERTTKSRGKASAIDKMFPF